MIGSHATSRALPDGGYHGVYKPFWTKEHSFVLDAKGNKKVFREAYEAEAHAWRTCKRVERERLDSLRLDPTQIQDIPKFHEARSRAGKRMFAERRLKQAMKEAAE